MDSTYAAHYTNLYRRHWWWRCRERIVLGVLRRLPIERGEVLDIGCGDALIFDRIEHLGDVWGVEPDDTIVSQTNRERGRIHIGPFDESFEPNRRFSLILMLDVIEHLENPAAALDHVKRLLVPGGIFLATVPALPWLWTSHDDFNRHYRRYTQPILGRSFREAGLEILDSRYFFHWTVVGKAVQVLKERLFRGSPKPAEIPAAPINWFLLKMSELEHRILGPFRLPFGSSIWIAAKEPGQSRARTIEST